MLSLQASAARLAAASLALLLAASVVGSFTRSLGAGLACGTDWPDCRGSLVLPDSALPVALEYFHRVLAGLGGLAAVAAGYAAVRGCGGSCRAGRLLGALLAGLVVVQVILGAIVVRTGLNPVLSAAHTATATATIASSSALTAYLWGRR